ncbi:MAG: D-alanyl-D-alanine carboxypeptidase [Gammaproteobacteria bacterium]|nr:D-alanyl-D-alanine carboxypeptidase [Gammaproteobacteria bacterium]MDH5512219.1 D-alanyl-D-alanine carboxypeptidase [Gammaproteobacteria bacterium]
MIAIRPIPRAGGRAGGILLAALFLCRPAMAAPLDVPTPDIPAPAWALLDHDSGQVLAENNGEKPLPPASLTKLMTAYVLFGKMKRGTLSPNDRVNISQRAIQARGARLFLRPGTAARVEDLLKGMLAVSANDAAIALVEHTEKNEANFVMQMNLGARALGLRQTVFVNATGHDESGHVSSARDLARLTSALIRDFPEYYPWFAQKEFTYNEITQHNHNALLWRDPGVDGVKTGKTRAAGYCLSASSQRDGMRLIATVLGARDEGARVRSGEKLLEHGFRHFETRLLYSANVPALRVRLWLGDQSLLPLGVQQNLYLTLPRGWHEKLQARLLVKEALTAPVEQGQVMGTLALELDRQPYAEYPLVALREVSEGNILQRTIDRIQLWLQ